MEEMDQKV